MPASPQLSTHRLLPWFYLTLVTTQGGRDDILKGSGRHGHVSEVTHQAVERGLKPSSGCPKPGYLHLVSDRVWPSVLPLITLGLPSADVRGRELKSNLWALCAQLTDSSATAHLPKILHIEEVEGLKELAALEAKLLTAGRQEGADILKAQELWRQVEIRAGNIMRQGRG